MGWGFWLLLAIDAVIGIGIFAGRNWLKASKERSVQHRFDARLEELRADLRKSEEGLKSELRLKEGQITALRDGVLSGRAHRQALLDKRRLEAVDRLEDALHRFAELEIGRIEQALLLVGIEQALGRQQFVDGNALIQRPAMRSRGRA